MSTSLRRRLLLVLLLVFTSSWVVVTIATYFESRHEIEELFDAQLAQEAGILAELVLESVESVGERHGRLSRAVYGHKYERYISFQVWDGDILHFRSFASPEYRLSDSNGFVDRELNGVRWRVFGMHDKSGRYTILAAESYRSRDELIEEITISALVPLLGALPLVAVLVWVGVGRGLQPLARVADEVARRSPGQLEPIPDRGVPQEVRPVTRALNGLLQRLQQAFEAERRFAADASHELRTPLAAIKTQAQVALRAADDASRNQALRNIVNGVDRSTRLVEQMLTLARLDPEIQGQVAQDRVDLVRVVEDVMADLEPSAHRAGVQLALACDADALGQCTLYGYGTGITVLVRNLVENAINHSPSGGQVSVTLGCHQDGWRLVVQDQGPGIAPEDRERVFDAFYRSSADTAPGSGLGLAIVKRVVALHRGSVSVRSAGSGMGTEIQVDFPVGP